MRRRRGTLTDQDRSDWAAFTRLIAALPGRALPPEAMPEPAPAPPPLPVPVPAAHPPVPAMARPLTRIMAVSVGDHPPGLDRATWNRFRSGKLAAARTLDLHGRTAQRAFHALQAFLYAAQADQVRCVEIITGRGSGEHGGVLRRELPLWLNLPALRPLVLAASHPHAANQGSVRVLLRRPR